jgi:branched-chain amino acid transport system ATP-binding protein
MVQLEVKNISKRFGGIEAIRDLDFGVKAGEILALIGPNGAGKSTVFNCINGIYRPDQGSILFLGEDIVGLKPHRIARQGIARTFQNIALFGNMTVLDNLLLGRNPSLRAGILWGGLFYGKALAEELESRRRVEEIIDFLEIERYRKTPVGALPFGVQKRVELGRALAMKPRVLLLDEPVAGMNEEETEDMARFIIDIKEELGVTILIVEHDMGVVMDISDRVVVINFGVKIAEGAPAEIVRNPLVIQAYLGEQGASLSASAETLFLRGAVS